METINFERGYHRLGVFISDEVSVYAGEIDERLLNSSGQSKKR
jgi:hypothetical protein